MTSLLRTKNFIPREAANYGPLENLGLSGWWSDVENSEARQYEIFYALSACYALLALVALVQLIRIQFRVPEYGWTTQKVFHFMNFVVTASRAFLFGFHRKVFLLKPTALEMMLIDLPGLLFFSTYTLLVLFWAEIYHQARSLPIDKLRWTYFLINGLVYFFQVCAWIYIRLSKNLIAVKLSRLLFSGIFFVAALGFLIYGGRLFMMLRRFPIESRGRQKKLQEVGYVTGICCSCFLIRCCMDALSAFDEDATLDVLNHPILTFSYYMVVEILPAAVVLFILRKLPPRRISDQYQSIS